MSDIVAVKCDVCGMLKAKDEKRQGWMTFGPRTIIYIELPEAGARGVRAQGGKVEANLEVRALVLRSDRHPVGTHERDEHGIPSCMQLIAELTTHLDKAAQRIDHLEGLVEETRWTLEQVRDDLDVIEKSEEKTGS